MNKELKKFLIEANKAGYASGAENNWKKEKDGSTTIVFESGKFKMHDNFFGGEPYGGRIIVFYKNKPHWIMVYYGAVKKGINKQGVYKFLREALKKMPKNAPFRGPKILKIENWKYENKWNGEIKNFKGKEVIFKNKEKVYWADYIGGLVDQD